MYKYLATTAAVLGLSLGFGAVATAADLGAPPPTPVYTKAPPPPAWSWTGFYLGGNAGWVRESTSGTSDFLDTGTAPPFNANPQSNSPSNSGFTGGAQLGYNWQVNPFLVLGAEGDWDWLNTKYNFCRQTSIDSVACVDNPSNIFGFESIGDQANWLATARGRMGFVAPSFSNVMFYGTGGAAWGSIETTESLSCLTDGCGSSSLKLSASSSATEIKAGWVAGLGVEGMLTRNWTVRAEWLHYDLGSITDTFSTTGNTGIQSVVWSRAERFDTVRVGVNYLFH